MQKRTVGYLEKELISKADFFSSTLDANCEDKEASLYAATATYYLALVTKGAERTHYAELSKKQLILLYPGIILGTFLCRRTDTGDIGLKTRGWKWYRWRITT